MIPNPQSRIVEMLEAIRVEFDQLAQEAYLCKSQRDDFEHKVNAQEQEMLSFQQSLHELERSQLRLKEHYEDEISRLRQQLDHAQQPSQYPGYPPHPPAGTPQSQQQQHQGHPPPAAGPPPPLNYMNGSPRIPPPPSSGTPQTYGSRGAESGPSPPHPPNSEILDKRKPGLTPGRSAPAAAVVKASSVLGGASNVPPGTLADVDPESVPANMKVEGKDWFALFNPKVPRYLTVNLIHTLDHASVVCCVKFSADGKYLAAGCNRTTFIYDVATSRRVCALQDESVQRDGDLYIRSVCFSPNGSYLATGAEDKQIRIWDIASGRIRNRLTGHEQDIYSLDFSRDGRIVVSGSGDRTVRIWSMADSSCMHTLTITDQDQKDPGVTSVAVSPDGRRVAAGSLDKMVRVWDIQTGEALERLEGHKDSVYSVAFMPDGRTLVSGSLDKTLKLWQLGTNEGRGFGVERDRSRGPCKMTFTGHKDFVLSVACTPDGRWIVSGSKDRSVQFWDPQTGQTQFMLQGHKNSVISVAISQSGRPVFATGSGDNRARIWSYDPTV
ncbi:WD40-repeat-containing domain protein [Dichotomocladium elegans]|nr:WD40-repeat-containing domain protein [Dichotomocladium elegans]